MKMLIIDDAKTMRKYLAFLATELAFATTEAGDGCEALDILGRPHSGEPFDIALVDWEMPRMDGLEFVRTVRQNPRLADLKLLMITTQNSLERVAEALEAGANDFLMKPITRDMLAEKLQILGLLE